MVGQTIENRGGIHMLSEKEKQVLRLVDENKGEIVEYLRRLIKFKTVTPPPNGKADGDDYRKLQDLICRTLKGMNFSLDTWEVDASKLKEFPGSGVNPDRDLSNMPVVVGKLKGAGKGKSLILNGHYDVVSPGVIENWNHDPFKGEIEGNRIFGRGAYDMKSGIAAMLEAVKFIQEVGVKLNGDLIIETVPEEELTSMGTLACCQKGYTGDAVIVTEPTNMDVLVAMRGNLTGKITVFGRAGHGDVLPPHWKEGGAVNAITKAVKIIQALEELTEEWRNRPDKQHRFLNPDMVIPTIIRGGEWIIMYPEKVEIEFDSDFIPGTADLGKEIEEKIMSVAATDPWMKEHPPKFEANPWLYGAEVDGNEPIVQTAIEAAKELGIEPKLVGVDSLTDAIHLINYSKIPTISFGASGGGAHEPNEFVNIDGLISATKVLALAIMRWCGYS